MPKLKAYVEQFLCNCLENPWPLILTAIMLFFCLEMHLSLSLEREVKRVEIELKTMKPR